jgi:hypothetical protein
LRYEYPAVPLIIAGVKGRPSSRRFRAEIEYKKAFLGQSSL